MKSCMTLDQLLGLSPAQVADQEGGLEVTIQNGMVKRSMSSRMSRTRGSGLA